MRGNQIVEHNLGNETVLGSIRKLGRAAEHLINRREKRICRLNFEFWSPHVIERRSKTGFHNIRHGKRFHAVPRRMSANAFALY